MRFSMAAARYTFWIVALPLAAIPASAETLRYAELAEFLDRAQAVSMPEDDLAARLRKVKLSTSVPAGALEVWERAGLAPQPLREIQRMALQSFHKEPETTEDSSVNPPAPAISQEQQAEAIENLRRYAAAYAQSIPNFTCVRITRLFSDKKGFGKWRKGDLLEEQLSLVNGQDSRKLVAVNGRTGKRAPRGGSIVAFGGEFGNLIRKLISPETRATFAWGRALAGNRALVQYKVPVETSSLTVQSRGQSRKIGYSGEIEVDRDTGTIYRIDYTQDPFPDDFFLTGAKVSIEYGPVEIEGSGYILPLRATMLAYLPPSFVRNDMEYHGYRKYDASSTVRFDDDPEPAARPDSWPPPPER